MNIKPLAGHSFDLDLIEPLAFCLDVGCHNFEVTRKLLELNCCVVAIDPDPRVKVPKDLERLHWNRLWFMRCALDSKASKQALSYFGDGKSNYLETVGPIDPVNSTIVQVKTLDGLSRLFGLERWDAIKLDCEGSEHRILSEMDRPWADQISVEFHDHCFQMTDDEYQNLWTHLSQWYDFYRFKREERHGSLNYWDVLLIRRGLHKENATGKESGEGIMVQR